MNTHELTERKDFMKFSKVLATVTACVLTVTGLSISSVLESHADTEELMNDTFERSYGAWKGVGASTTLSSDQANTGDESLYVYDRTASWGAPRCSLSTIVAEGYTYEISGYTYFEGSGSQNVGLKMLYTDSDGTDHYDNISYTYVNADTSRMARVNSFGFADSPLIFNERETIATPSTRIFCVTVKILACILYNDINKFNKTPS